MKNKFLMAAALVLVLAMALPAGITAYAEEAGPYTVTIIPNSHVSTPGDEPDSSSSLATRFHAYQVFSGVVDEWSTGNGAAGSTDFGEMSQGTFGSVDEWGSGISSDDYSDLLIALLKSDIKLSNLGISDPGDAGLLYEGSATLGDIFEKALEKAGYSISKKGIIYQISGNSVDDHSLKKSGAVIAKVLSDFTKNDNNRAFARAFAKILAAKNNEGAYDYLASPEAESVWTGNEWKIGGMPDGPLQGGYYLIIDENGNGDGDSEGMAYSDFIMGVFGDTEVYVKADAPTVTKTILNSNGNPYGGSFEMGEPIQFQLTGTLPSNFADYDEYQYAFVDKSDYLHLPMYSESDIKVYARVADPVGETGDTIDINISNCSGVYRNKSQANYINVVESFNVTISDLKSADFLKSMNEAFHKQYDKLDGAYSDKSVTVASDSIIYVTYSAYFDGYTSDDYVSRLSPDLWLLELPQSCGLDGRLNTVQLDYPNSGGGPLGSTVEKTAKAYTFDLDLYKYDGSLSSDDGLGGAYDAGSASNDGLGGAGFTITKTENGVKYYAAFFSGLEYDLVFGGPYQDLFMSPNTGGGSGGDLTGPQSLDDGVQLYAGRPGGNTPPPGPGGSGDPTDPSDKTPSRTDWAEKGHYIFAGWIKEQDLKDFLDVYTIDGMEVTKGQDGVISKVEWERSHNIIDDRNEWDKITSIIQPRHYSFGYTPTWDSGNVYAFSVILISPSSTDESGHITISGLKEGEYTITEEYAPEGYDPVDPITVKFDADYYDIGNLEGKSEGMIKSLKATVAGSDGESREYTIVEDGSYAEGYDSLKVSFGIPNYPTMGAPGTGGTGTGAIYAIGGLFLVSSLILFATRRKKAA